MDDTTSAERFSWLRLFERTRDAEKDSNLRVLRQVPLFRTLRRAELKRLARIVHERTYDPGEHLFERGQPGAAMFVLKSGGVEIVLPNKEGEETRLATLGPGSFVGELALLDDTPRSASARALERTDALAFFRADLDQLLETAPRVGSKIFRELALLIGRRLKRMNEQLSAKERSELYPKIGPDERDEPSYRDAL